MGIFDRGRKQKRSNLINVGIWFPDDSGGICPTGYTSLANNPEIIAGVNKIASLVASQTIHLMANTERGDVRVRNELSRKIDVNPYRFGTRQTWLQAIVRNLLLDGGGNSFVLPEYRDGYIEDLYPVPPSAVSMTASGSGYTVQINGVEFMPEQLLHFVWNPDPDYPWRGQGYKVPLREVAGNLQQAAITKKSFLSSKWKPGLIVKVDANTEELATESGREKILESYIGNTAAGKPWIIPAEAMSVEQVKPLSLTDLAISDSVSLDKRTVAAILGVPPFVLGVGDFDEKAWNHCVSTTLMPISQEIAQEMTKKLLISPELYFRFNSRSLYSYDLTTLSDVGNNEFVRGIMTGNEVRDWLGLSPMEGLDELVILENYIPRGMIGEQSKLNGGGENND